MAIKTFTTGEVLTASDTNTYLANAGLVYIKSVTIVSGASTTPVTNCFSSTYDNYRVVINGVQTSAALGLCIRLGSTATGYFGNMSHALYTATAFTLVPMNNATFFYVGLSDNSAPSTSTSFDIFQPYLTTKTMYSGVYYGRGYMGNFGGSLENSTSYTDLNVLNESGTLTSGTITVFGYRKA